MATATSPPKSPTQAPTPPAQDPWSKWASERYTGYPTTSPTTQAASKLLSLSLTTLPLTSQSHLLDIGCGTCAITTALLASHSPLPAGCRVTASDLSPGVLAQARAIGEREGWGPEIELRRLNALDLSKGEDGGVGVPDESVSHVLSSYVFYFLGEECVQEAYRVLVPGGVFATASVIQAQWMEVLMTLSVVRPEKVILGGYKAFREENFMRTWCRKAGFGEYSEEVMDVWVEIGDKGKLVDLIVASMPFLGPLTVDLTEEEKVRWRELMIEWLGENCKDGKLRGKALMTVGRK